jgi:hypothetical protein
MTAPRSASRSVSARASASLIRSPDRRSSPCLANPYTIDAVGRLQFAANRAKSCESLTSYFGVSYIEPVSSALTQLAADPAEDGQHDDVPDANGREDLHLTGTRLVPVPVGRVVSVTVGALVDKALLDRHGVRLTARRLVSCGTVSDRPQSAAAMLAAVVWSEIGGVSLQAVEDALVTLTDTSIIGRIQPAGSAARCEDLVDANLPPSGLPNLRPCVDAAVPSARRRVRQWPRTGAKRSTKPRSSIGADVPTASRRVLSGRAGDRVPVPRKNRGETALNLRRRASARTDHHRNETVST